MRLRHSIANSASISYQQGSPLRCLQQWRSFTEQSDRLLLVDFTIEDYWLEGEPVTQLTAIYLESQGRLTVSVTDQALHSSDQSVMEQHALWVQQCGLTTYVVGQLVELASLAIPKPWGQEIWYTGVEERGVCGLITNGNQTPIPWLQATIPDEELGVFGEPLVLLKILDPVAEPVTGDLYFELHEEKQEVYVVTRVDSSAWPDGTGFIRIGFDKEKLAAYEQNEQGFKNAYLQAVKDYENVRREIDGLGQTPSASRELFDREVELRTQMDSFSHLRPLRIGDVVKVPLLTPHSLQHGVRTVEFQTPVYERKILSFAQKVLTQDHWDTEEAVAQMQLEHAAAEVFECLLDEPGRRVERIVDFSDFEVRRVRLDPDRSLEIEPMARYGLIMLIEGQLSASGMHFAPEQAFIIPRGWSGSLTASQPALPLVFLLALPRH